MCAVFEPRISPLEPAAIRDERSERGIPRSVSLLRFGSTGFGCQKISRCLRYKLRLERCLICQPSSFYWWTDKTAASDKSEKLRQTARGRWSKLESTIGAKTVICSDAAG